jgi:hypothetical protein
VSAPNFIDLFQSNPGFVLLNELKHVQSNLSRLGWSKDSIDKAIDALECMRQKTREYLKNYSDKWHSTNDKHFLDSSLLFKLSLNNLPTPFSRETLTTTSDQRNLEIPQEMHTPIITPYMIGMILAHKSNDFIEILQGLEIAKHQIREFYGIIFLVNMWQLKKINLNNMSDFTDVCFWTKNAALAYDNFNCLDRWANVTMCSNLSDWDESIMPKKQSNYESELASNRAKVILISHETRSRGGKGKMKECRAFTISHKNKVAGSKPTHKARHLYKRLEENNFFNEKKFSSKNQGIDTIRNWIINSNKAEEHEDKNNDDYQILLNGIKKL